MKTLASLLLVLSMGCGGSSGGGATTPVTPEPVPAEPTPTEPIPPTEPTPPTEPAPPAADAAKNLKVMPAGMSLAQVEDIMKKGISPALGVECEFCHDVKDFAADTNEHKEIAREMMRMTMSINQTYWKGEFRVTCSTCHQGKEKPAN